MPSPRPSEPDAPSWALAAVTRFLFAMGFVVRIVPLFDPAGRGLRQYVHEDGYLMQTLARNMALGHGMSVEAGETASNGTQPLTTFLYAGLHALAGGDKVLGIWLGQALSVVVAMGAAWLLYRVARDVLPATAPAGLAGLATALWFAAPLVVRMGTNGLETGYYVFALLLIARYVLGSLPPPDEDWPWSKAAVLGVLVGVAFWTRNDAVLFAAALCLTRAGWGLRSGGGTLGRRFAEACVVGATALVIVAPWVIHNQLRFGHIVPISGVAEGFGRVFMQNLPGVPATLSEVALVVVLIPSKLETTPAVIAGGSIVLAVAAWTWVALTRRIEGAARFVMVAFGVTAVFFGCFYGLAFGADHFLSRYFNPLSPFFALVAVWAGSEAVAWVSARSEASGRAVAALAIAAAVGLAALGHWRSYAAGMDNGHFAIVSWVEEHVPEDVWVGAIQTGTLGYFHDRTFNLDGKVSPAALEARLAGRIPEYVVEQPIAYLVDWTGIVGWMQYPPIHEHFEVRVNDERRNLAVLARTDPPAPSR